MFVQKQQPVNIRMISDIMGIDYREVNKALARLADAGWINDEGYEIKLCIPSINHKLNLSLKLVFWIQVKKDLSG